jgi:hypothetical protein
LEDDDVEVGWRGLLFVEEKENILDRDGMVMEMHTESRG